MGGGLEGWKKNVQLEKICGHDCFFLIISEFAVSLWKFNCGTTVPHFSTIYDVNFTQQIKQGHATDWRKERGRHHGRAVSALANIRPSMYAARAVVTKTKVYTMVQ